MTIHFHDRASIGLRAPDTAHLTKRTAPDRTTSHAGLTWHWTGEGGALFHPDPVQRLRGIQGFHMGRLGYGDIAYEGAFDAYGNTFGLRDGAFVGAHAASHANVANRLTDGIVFLEDSTGWTAAAAAAFDWWAQLYLLGHRRKPTLFAHEWWTHVSGTATQCPGPALRATVMHHGGLT